MKKKPPLIPIIIVAVVAIAAVVVFLVVKPFGETEKPIIYTPFVPGDAFITNVKDNNKLIKISIVLIVDTNTLEMMLKDNLHIIRDTILFILRDTELSVFSSIEVKDYLSERIVAALNERLEIENFVGIDITDLVIQ